MRIVFRFEVLDTSTGKRVTDKDGATIRVRLPHGEDVAARWAIRGSVNALPHSAWMWDASWDIPPDYPVGSLDYRIEVSLKDARKGTFTPPIQKTPSSDTACESSTNGVLYEKRCQSCPGRSANSTDSRCTFSRAWFAGSLWLRQSC
jgi:hypothetical protein